jgi:hypothetical protein
MTASWNASLHKNQSVVWEYGRDLVQFLAPQSGEPVLDFGWAPAKAAAWTGHLFVLSAP